MVKRDSSSTYSRISGKTSSSKKIASTRGIARHNLRYVLKNRRLGDAYLVVNIALLFGEDMKQASQEENEPSHGSSIQHPIVESSPVYRNAGESIALTEMLASPVEEFRDARPF
jgi:hypothetical protein